jgi:hypothetical protein
VIAVVAGGLSVTGGLLLITGLYLSYYWGRVMFVSPATFSDDPVVGTVERIVATIQRAAAFGAGLLIVSLPSRSLPPVPPCRCVAYGPVPEIGGCGISRWSSRIPRQGSRRLVGRAVGICERWSQGDSDCRPAPAAATDGVDPRGF